MASWTDIGSLDTLVTVMQAVITQGDRGQKTITYGQHSEVYAGIRASTDEVVNNSNLEQGEDLTLTIYKIAGLTTRWRILIHGKPYEIRSIDPIDRISPLCELGLHAIDR